MNQSGKLQIAVIGGGVAGVTASYLLQQKHDVTLFEKNDYVGGHTNTIVIDSGPDEGLAVDTGFIVLNNKNYPNFHRLLANLGVPVRWSDMSFAYSCEETGFEYAGTTLNGLFSQRSNLFRPSFYGMLAEIVRFCRRGSALLDQDENNQPEQTLGQFIAQERFHPRMVESYLLPMGGAIWSASGGDILDFPVKSFLHFFRNHGLLGLRNRPQWQTVVGGSFSYIKRFRENFRGEVRISQGVVSLKRTEGKVAVAMADGSTRLFDRAVVATHADEALALLQDASAEERRLLGPWRYQRNQTLLHTDCSVLPVNRRAWASWNYRRKSLSDKEKPVMVTYHMNRLQGLKTARDYLVSLNLNEAVAESRVVREIHYYHPIYDFLALRTQPELASLNGKNNTWYCGSYFGYGFHEDAVRSALAVGKDFGIEL